MEEFIVAYLCDGKACGDPRPESCGTTCKHTVNLHHAVNFRQIDHSIGYWAESEEPKSYSEFARRGGYGEYERKRR